MKKKSKMKLYFLVVSALFFSGCTTSMKIVNERHNRHSIPDFSLFTKVDISYEEFKEKNGSFIEELACFEVIFEGWGGTPDITLEGNQFFLNVSSPKDAENSVALSLSEEITPNDTSEKLFLNYQPIMNDMNQVMTQSLNQFKLGDTLMFLVYNIPGQDIPFLYAMSIKKDYIAPARRVVDREFIHEIITKSTSYVGQIIKIDLPYIAQINNRSIALLCFPHSISCYATPSVIEKVQDFNQGRYVEADVLLRPIIDMSNGFSIQMVPLVLEIK